MRATTTCHPVLRRLTLLVVGSVLLAGYSGTSFPTSAPSAGAALAGPPVDEPGGAEAELERAVAELAAMPGGPPGVIVVVQRGERRTTHAAGTADVQNGAIPQAEDHVRVGSVAKAFTAATALSLVDEGVLGLDDTIAQRRPDLPTAWGGVTLRQALNHTSGLPDFSGSPGFAAAVTASLATAPPPWALLSFVEDQPLRFVPGTEYTYSNSDNVVAASMIESATGRPFASVLQTEVLDPLGSTTPRCPKASSCRTTSTAMSSSRPIRWRT